LISALARPAADVVDALAARIPRSPFRYTAPNLVAQELTGTGLSQLLSEFGTDDCLRPVVTDGSTEWLVTRAQSMKRFGDLQMIVLRDASGRIAGWYVYCARPEGSGDVLQVVATSSAGEAVLTHLARHARERGVISLTGTLDPVLLSALSEHWALMSPAPMVTRWRMVYSTRPEVLDAFLRDRILLSRLDGEWCQQFT
jgi:hypothetical protein